MLGRRGDQSKLDPDRQPICLLLGRGMAAGKSTVRNIIGKAEFWTRVRLLLSPLTSHLSSLTSHLLHSCCEQSSAPAANDDDAGLPFLNGNCDPCEVLHILRPITLHLNNLFFWSLSHKVTTCCRLLQSKMCLLVFNVLLQWCLLGSRMFGSYKPSLGMPANALYTEAL